MLKLTHVTKTYKDFNLDISMEIRPGRIVGLLGRNGSGKTTLFKAILNLIQYGGEIEVFGHQLTTKDKEEIGVVLPDITFNNQYTLKEIRTLLKYFYTNFDQQFYDQKIKEFSLPLNKKLKTFSTGMKAKAKIIMAMSHHPHLLLLDEPTLGLDVVARDEILTLLRDYMDDERCILISSPISSDLESLCDEFYMIDKGHIILNEDINVLNENYAVIKVENLDLDRSGIICQKKENYGYQLLTNHRQYYIDNYPQLNIEKCSIDNLIFLLIKGENV